MNQPQKNQPLPLLLRADIFHGQGSGHIFRVLALAQAWQKLGGKSILATNCSNQGLLDTVRDSGLEITKINDDPTGEKTCQLAEQYSANFIVTDGYHFSPSFQQTVRSSGFPLLMIEDGNNQPSYQADFLLVPGLGASTMGFNLAPWTQPLFGPYYSLLRHEFLSATKDRSPKPQNILVTFGGEDQPNMTSLALESLLASNWKGKITTLIGQLNPHRKKLEQFQKDEIDILYAPQNMPALLSQTDILIGAGGGTCWEAFYFGIPCLNISIADNQTSVLKRLDQAGALVYIGQSNQINKTSLTDSINIFLKSTSMQEQISYNASRLVDGYGVNRVINHIAAWK